MNNVQIHLALTHVPVILSITGLAILIVSFFIKNNTITRTAYIMLLVAGIMALPVYFSGEGTEEVIESLPGISEPAIEEHEEVAQFAIISIGAAGLMALIALITQGWKKAALGFQIIVLILSVVSAGFLFQTAHLGGLIRHTELQKEANAALKPNQNNHDNTENETDH